MKKLFYIFIASLVFTGCSVEPLEPMAETNENLEIKNLKAQYSQIKFGTPQLTAGEATEYSLGINVTAGDNGATGGFSLRWMTLENYDPDNDGNGDWNDALGGHILYNGKADDMYSLEEGETITLSLPADPSGEVGLPMELNCGMSFVFIVQAHQDGKIQKSDYSEPFVVSTAPCEPNCDLLKQEAYSMEITESALVELLKSEDAPLGDVLNIDEVFYSLLEDDAPIVPLNDPKLAALYSFYLVEESKGATVVPLVYNYEVQVGDCRDSAVLTINVTVE